MILPPYSDSDSDSDNNDSDNDSDSDVLSTMISIFM